MKHVYKIFRTNDWIHFQNTGTFAGSVDDLRDGFIHLAKDDQVDRVIRKFFSTEEIVYIAGFLTSSMGDSLKWESNSPSGDIYPHLYEIPLTLTAFTNFRTAKGNSGQSLDCPREDEKKVKCP